MPRAARRFHLLAGLVVAGVLLVPPRSVQAQAGEIAVPAAGNLFAAGGNASVGDGVAPALVTLDPGASRVLRFGSVTGSWQWVNLPLSSGPDGMVVHPETDVGSLGRIAGIRAPRAFWLAGVFLGDDLPAATPSRLDYVAGGIDLGRPSFDFVGLGQTFFIGDGRDAGGAQQQRTVAVGATRLFLGTIDAGGFVGAPGAYGDNSGALQVSYVVTPGAPAMPVTPVPEPGSALLLAGGALAGGLVRRARRVR